MIIGDATLWLARIAAGYYFAGLVYNVGLRYEQRIWRGLRSERSFEAVDYDQAKVPKSSMAIMVPAWREENVIGRTLGFLVSAAEAYDPSLVKVYVGTYPNDAETRSVVRRWEENYPSIIEEVVNERPGPTTKAQNINNIYRAVAKGPFELVGLQDSEDFVPQIMFKAVNYWYQAKVKNDERLAGLQFAVRAKPDNYSVTNMMYMTMFRTSNLFLAGKERGIIPSHGAATYYRLSALEEVRRRRGFVWDEKNMTEDFELSAYMYYSMGKTLFYVPYPYVEEYFPSDFKRSVRQVSRWQYGGLQSAVSYASRAVKGLLRDPGDSLYVSFFGFYPLSLLWFLGIPYLVSAPLRYPMPVTLFDEVFFTINFANGLRWLVEMPLLYERTGARGERRVGAGERAWEMLKELYLGLHASLLAGVASAYMVGRYLLFRRKAWLKTEHK